MLIAFQQWMEEEEEEEKRKRTIQILALHQFCSSIQNRNYIVSRALGTAKDSTWFNLYHHGDDGSFVCTMRLSQSAFNTLFLRFGPFFDVRSGPGKQGRPTDRV
jgi:hypothetical protein